MSTIMPENYASIYRGSVEKSIDLSQNLLRNQFVTSSQISNLSKYLFSSKEHTKGSEVSKFQSKQTFCYKDIRRQKIVFS